MLNINTFVSYSLRTVILFQVSLLGFLFFLSTRDHFSASSSSLLYFQVCLVGATAVLLLADWFTRKDPSRRFSKLIDTFAAISWIVIVGVLVIHSLAMGMP